MKTGLVFAGSFGFFGLAVANTAALATANASGRRVDFHVSCHTIGFKDALVGGRAEEETSCGRIVYRE